MEAKNGFQAEHDDPGCDSKQERLDRLSHSAIELFARQGYEGTSLRDITTHADVPLSTVDRYFGGKLDLFNEVQHHVWKEVNRDREALLRSPISVTEEGEPTVEAVLHALIYPVVVRAIGDEDCAPMVRLLRENTSVRVHMGIGRGPKRALLAEDWLETLHAACPQLTKGEAVWALSFTIATMYCGQLLDGWLDDLMPEQGPSSPEEVTKLMVDFCRGGVMAITANR